MLITKSLFVDYKDFSKLAWWKVNNLDTYKRINWLDDEETEIAIIELWKSVEDKVWEYLKIKFWYEKLDLFDDNPLSDEDDEDEILNIKYKDKLKQNIERTKKAIQNKTPLIYQGGFIYKNSFVRVDFLKLNQNWNYDLIEVKAKSWIRKDKTIDWENIKNIWKVEDNFINDISFQKYVITKSIEENKLWINIDKTYFAYLNYEYKLSWKLDIEKLIVLDEVNTIKTIILNWEKKQKEEIIDDTLLSFWIIEENIKQIENDLILNEESFNNIYPFLWSKYEIYFWKDREYWTIYSKWIIHQSWIRNLHFQNKLYLDELEEKDLNLFNKWDWSKWSARVFIDNYLYSKKTNKDIIIKDKINEELSKLEYPLCFYDYETISVPIPIIENTSPYQQVVVQYSLHKLYEDWSIKHYWWIYMWDSREEIKIINIDDNKNKVQYESEKVIYWNHKTFLEEFINDIWDDINSSFIVWNKGFENSRNKEMSKTYDDLSNSYLTINDNTFDLMDIFKKWYYFSLWFKWSNSIKYVLPYLISNMTYDNMWVPNWWVAMKLLNDLIIWKYSLDEKEEYIKDLLLYCGQDSLAMLEIYKKVKL